MFTQRASLRYWICQLLGWSGTALVNVTFALAYQHGDVLVYVSIFGWGVICGIGLSHLWRAVIHRLGLIGPRGTVWGRLMAGVALFGLLQVGAVSLGFAFWRPPGSFKNLAWLPSALLFWTFIFLIWTTIYAAISSMRQARRFESEALRLEVLAKDAELRALQAQVNPHFFFNSLNSVRALIFESPPAAAQMVDQLASMMRYALQYGGAATVTLAQELEAVQAYLAIEKIRFEERLRFTLDVENGVQDRRIPPMVLQTLVENAVKYGVEPQPAGNDIRIVITREARSLQVVVANRGALAPFADSTRIGLENARKRIALSFGANATLTLNEEAGEVVARLTIPELN